MVVCSTLGYSCDKQGTVKTIHEHVVVDVTRTHETAGSRLSVELGVAPVEGGVWGDKSNRFTMISIWTLPYLLGIMELLRVAPRTKIICAVKLLSPLDQIVIIFFFYWITKLLLTSPGHFWQKKNIYATLCISFFVIHTHIILAKLDHILKHKTNARREVAVGSKLVDSLKILIHPGLEQTN